MKITIVGASGNIGRRITQEAASRGHELNLITSKDKDFFGLDNVQLFKADAFKEEEMSSIFKGSDVVISSYAPPHDNTDLVIDASKHLISAAKKAGVKLVAVGGAGSLKVNETTQLVDTADFPQDYKAIALSHRTALEEVYLNEKELEWTNVSPSAYIFEGERTNNFRIGEDNLLVDAKGNSSISMEDFAVGILDEVENPKFIQKRFTIGY